MSDFFAEALVGLLTFSSILSVITYVRVRTQLRLVQRVLDEQLQTQREIRHLHHESRAFYESATVTEEEVPAPPNSPECIRSSSTVSPELSSSD